MSDITYLDHDPRGIHGPALADLERNDHVHIRTSDVCIKNLHREPCRVDWRARALEAEAKVDRVAGLVKDWRRYHHPRQGAFSGAVIECADDVERMLRGES